MLGAVVRMLKRRPLFLLLIALAGCQTAAPCRSGAIVVRTVNESRSTDGYFSKAKMQISIEERLLEDLDRLQRVLEHEMGHMLLGSGHTSHGLMSPNGDGDEVTDEQISRVAPDVFVHLVPVSDDHRLWLAMCRAMERWNKRLGRRAIE